MVYIVVTGFPIGRYLCFYKMHLKGNLLMHHLVRLPTIRPPQVRPLPLLKAKNKAH